MNIRKEMELIGSLKCTRAYFEAQKVKPLPPPPEPEPIDWIQRQMVKNSLFFKYLIIMGLMIATIVTFVIVPMWFVHVEYAKALLLALPPMLFVALTWMCGCWWAYDKERFLFMAVTIGVIPIRLGFCLTWSMLVLQISNLSQMAYLLGCMIFWTAFTAIEIGMVQGFTKSLSATAQIEPPGLKTFPEFEQQPQ